MIANGHREPATIESVSASCDDDCGGRGFWVQLRYEGSGQGFGGFRLDEGQCARAAQSICVVFEVEKFEDLVGKKCFALKDFTPGFSEFVVGLETTNGRRFIMRDWCAREIPGYKREDPLQERLKSLRTSIAADRRRIADREKELRTIHMRYHEWKE